MKSNRLLLVIFAALGLLVVSCGKKESAEPALTAPSVEPTASAKESVAEKTRPATNDFNGHLQAVVQQLGTELGGAKTAPYSVALAEPGASPHAALGVVAFLGQNLELATWLYGQGVIANPENDVYLNNFGMLLHEKALLMMPKKQPGSGGGGSIGTPATASAMSATDYMILAKESLEKAVILKSENAAYQSNLGFALLEIWRSNADANALQNAVTTLKKAVLLNPKSATAWAHLAEALAAQKDLAGAADALEKSRALGAFNGALMSAGLRMPPEVMDEYKKKSQACKVEFQCKANCPKSIIGQINFVTCEMEQSSAQMACEAGKPYAAGFDCSEQIPEFGILIPGLNSGFSFITPWGRLDMTIDGKGNVDYRFKASTSVGGVGIGATTRGSWSPESGFSSIEIKPGVSYNLVGGDAAKLMGEAKMGPASISMERNPKTGETDLVIKAYGGVVFSH
ncbi:MAG: tetratricopeptide repeat protein [Methylococcales bacterium]